MGLEDEGGFNFPKLLLLRASILSRGKIVVFPLPAKGLRAWDSGSARIDR